MNIIFCRRHGRPVTLALNPQRLTVIGLLAVTLPLVLGAVGWNLAAEMRPERSLPMIVGKAGNGQTEQLKAMTSRVAEMQADMLRLNALGEHLAEKANIKGKEFDFSQKPMGGPLTGELSVLGDAQSVALASRLEELSREIDQKETQLQALESVMSGRENLPSVYLANIPVHRGYVTSRYGYRGDPFTKRVAFHAGVDFGGPTGTDIYSTAGGVVVWAGPKSGYGNTVEVRHGDGYVTRYAHASRLAVKVGDIVDAGQLVAYMGSTGRSTAPHLHYEVLKNGAQIDPATFIAHARR